MLIFIFCLLLTFFVYADDTQGSSNTHSFTQFLSDIRSQATKLGISQATLNGAFNDLTPNPKVLEYDRNQAEFNLNFWHYLNSRVSQNRRDKGVIKLQQYQQFLQENYKKYGVPSQIIVAFWGLETNYGKNVGKMNLIRSLATLSFDKRRSQFFTRELLTLLKLIDEKKLPLNAQGSWAGAMGSMQFMPTNVAVYAIDANIDGKIDLWHTQADIFASAAHFLKKIGWHSGERWGREVKIPKTFDHQLANLNTKKTVNEWQVLGIRTVSNNNLPNSNMRASLILPMGYNGPAFLVYRNFRAILRWNRSILYALSVGHLSDRLIGANQLFAKSIAEPSLSSNNIKQIQTTLNQLGFDTGEPDGVSGPKTRHATRAYQKTNNLPIDGYVGYQLLQQLQ
jgi:membrane-bound lytic murein transglycosylase B